MGSRRALYGVLRVNVLIHRGLREKAKLGPLTPMHAASGVCPAYIRRLSGVAGCVQQYGFAAAGTEPFRSGKRVRTRITARQAPFRQERGTPCGCASLRGVDRPRPRP